MTRRDFLRSSALAAAAFALGCGRRSPSTSHHPNLVLVVCDTLRADHVGCYGSPLGLTPAMDGLAQRGTRFARVMSCAPTTGPSHATLMTGTYPTRHGVIDNYGVMAEGRPTLAETLREAGYQTAAFVSNCVLRPEGIRGIERGFDSYDCTLPSVERNRPSEAYRKANDTTEAVLRWLAREARPPFFLWVHLMEPHGPYEVPDPALLDRVPPAPARAGEPATLPVLADSFAPGGIPAYQLLGKERRPREYRRRYAARVAYVDRYVGRVLEGLPTGNTVVALLADHGELLGEHGYYFEHGVTLTEPVLRVPLLLAGPGLPAGKQVDLPVSNADLGPTLLELAGVSAKAGMQGRSLAPVLKGASGETRPLFAVSARGKEWGVRVGDLKCVRREGGGTGREELFDLAADPGEQRNVAGSRAAEAGRLGKLLDGFEAENPGLFAQAGKLGSGLSPEEQQRLRSLGYIR